MEQFKGQLVLAAIEAEREVGKLACLGVIYKGSESVGRLLLVDD